MDTTNTLLLIPVVSIMAYIFPLCVLDVWYREVENWYWLPLILVNFPGMLYFYYTGLYPIYCLAISLVTIGIFAYMVRIDLLNGADFIFLSLIALFWIVNPNPWPHGVQLQFYVYLIVAMLITAAVLPFANYLRGKRSDSLYEMMSNYPRGVPYMLTISFAFVLSYLWG